MAKYKIFRSFGFAGDCDVDEVECDSQEDAEEFAWDWAYLS